jgi:hypothetical protein
VTRPVDGVLRISPDDLFISFSLPEGDASASLQLRKLTLIRKGS